MEVEKWSAPAKNPPPPGWIFGPSGGPIWASENPLRLIFGLILGILKEKAQSVKNEGPSIVFAHFWGPGMALKLPSWGHVGLKLAS